MVICSIWRSFYPCQVLPLSPLSHSNLQYLWQQSCLCSTIHMWVSRRLDGGWLLSRYDPNYHCVNVLTWAVCVILHVLCILSSDVHECNGLSPCEQRCNNTIGSYNCSCDVGYSLARDMHSCLGIQIFSIAYVVLILELLSNYRATTVHGHRHKKCHLTSCTLACSRAGFLGWWYHRVQDFMLIPIWL